MRTAEEYKNRHQEFTEASRRHNSNHAEIYKVCKDDFPPIIEEVRKEKFKTLLTQEYPNKYLWDWA